MSTPSTPNTEITQAAAEVANAAELRPEQIVNGPEAPPSSPEERIATLEAALTVERTHNRRQSIGAAAGLTPFWIDRLNGETIEELTADAAKLASDLQRSGGPAVPTHTHPRRRR